jgi:hypothetical protein
MNGMTSEACSLPYQRTFFGEKLGDFSAHELVADRLVAVGVELVGIAHIPCPRGNTIVITNGFLDR